MTFSPRVNDTLKALTDSSGQAIFIGRTKATHEKYGRNGALLLGRLVEEDGYGKLVYLDAIAPHVIFISGARGSGKCLLPTENVLMADGSLKTIKEIFDELSDGRVLKKDKNEELIQVTKNVRVISLGNDLKQKFSRISHVYRKKVSENLVKLRTRSGREVTVTKEHPLLVIDEEPKWVKAGKISKGAYIAIPRELRINPKGTSFNFSLECEQSFSNAHSQLKEKFLHSLINGPKQVSVALDSSHSWDIAHALEEDGLITLKRNSPLTATLTEKGRQHVQELSSAFVRFTSRSLPIKTPQVSKEFARFIAYVLAEGTEVLKNNKKCYRLMFTNKEVEKKEDFAALTNELFGLDAKDNNMSKYVDSWGLKLFLDEIGYKTGRKSREKVVPQFILTAPNEIVAEFLRVFIDCEGYVSKTAPEIQISTASPSIANGLAYLLLRFGIFSTVKEKMRHDRTRRKYYDVTIYGTENLRKFKEHIGFMATRKQDILDTHLGKKSNPNYDTIPCIGATLKFVRNRLGLRQKDISHKSAQKAYEDGKYYPSRKALGVFVGKFRAQYNLIQKLYKRGDIASLKELRKVIGDKNRLQQIRNIILSETKDLLEDKKLKEKMGLLENLVNSDVYWDEIVEVESIPYKGYVYDITVQDTHNFIAGTNGGIVSHNSYDLGVMIEELNTKNPNVASVIIDPIGIYWSMKYPNQDEKELDELIRMGLTPKGVDKVNVFVPYGVRDKLPKGTFDKVYALRPADLTVEDWCLTFDIDRFSPTGLLLEKTVEKVMRGYVTKDGKKVDGNPEYGIDDIINCLNNDKELTSSAKGFKVESRRALVSRFEAAKSWGIFTEEGTPLVELCKEGEVSVIDVSFLDEKVTSLVIGILARKILNARKLSTRKTAMKRFAANMDDLLETEIPPTWLFIDEAHTLIPSGSKKTAASDALIEYVKQGRRPGCSLVFATQQPSAIDTRILSQLDILICHKLVFDDDLKAVFKRMPAEIPKEYSKRFIKTLPIGTCLVGDRSDETSRVFAMKIRPRFSQHEGREAKAVEFEEAIKPEQVKRMLIKMIIKEIEEKGRVSKRKINQLTETIKKRYKVKIKTEEIINGIIEDERYEIKNEYIRAKQEEEPEEQKEIKEEFKPGETILAFKPNISERTAEKIARKHRKKKFLWLIGDEEFIKNIELELHPIYKVEYDRYEKRGFRRSTCYVDGITGEILSVGKDGLESTKGAGLLSKLSPNKRRIVIVLKRGKKASAKGLAGYCNITETTARTNAEDLVEMGILQSEKDGRTTIYSIKQKLSLPEKDDVTKPKYTMLETHFVVEETNSTRAIAPKIPKENIADIPKIFGEIRIRNISLVYRPVYHVWLVSKHGPRHLYIDGMNGKIIERSV
ncbi:MAG: DUF87 domain-containing protein [Candidatus Diapherotrites archaeon]|nr:DUF87 domain-containing protein [Candidatus Diapherotrites archaeon]